MFRFARFLWVMTAVLVARPAFAEQGAADDDFDADGVADEEDNCPFKYNPARRVPAGEDDFEKVQPDADGDGVGDACDNCPAVENGDQSDIDEDRVGDACDNDVDGDGILGENAGGETDNCPSSYNPQQRDIDGDGIGDACDDDIDGDGVFNNVDDCPMATTPANEDECNRDSDGDGVQDFALSEGADRDNCPYIPNPRPENGAGQADLDKDGVGDACDPDIDGDGVENLSDNCPSIANEDQLDEDRNGLGNACDDDYCYVLPGGDGACFCYEPEGECPEGGLSDFSVYTPPSMIVSTLEEAPLRLFVNRRDARLSYRWELSSDTRSGLASISDHEGVTQSSQDFEYSYDEGGEPVFKALRTGNYQVKVSVEQLDEDELTGQSGLRAEATATIQVVGLNYQDISTCGCKSVGSPGMPPRPQAWLIALLMLGLLAARSVGRNR